VPGLLQRAIASQRERERELLQAMAVCSPEGFWLPPAAGIAGLNEAERREARDRLLHASLLRVLDRDRQRFQLHALLREQLLLGETMVELRERHVSLLEGHFRDWESLWRECRECLSEVIPAMQFLWQHHERYRMAWLAGWGFMTGWRTGELAIALRILNEEEGLWARSEDTDAKSHLQRIYGNQALILQDWGRLEEAMALLQKQEALCLKLGNKAGLGYCYWSWGLLARAQKDGDTERTKLRAALEIFTELNMPREREAVQDELKKIRRLG
jgi:hypothetical protein